MSAAKFKDTQIEMAHGAGGKASRRLIEGLIVPLLQNPILETLGDAAALEIDGARLAFTMDAFVVKPLRFPGGSIGDLAVNGTVNDLAVSGARPVALVSSLILEAGLTSDILEQELRAMGEAAVKAGVRIVGGDTKVVEHGQADSMYITTAGIGLRDARVNLCAKNAKAGDQVIVSGCIGDHGITILLARGELDLEADLQSDTRSVWSLVNALLEVAAPGLRWMRDPTRGGVATALNELARDANLGVMLLEDQLPIRDEVRGACEILGLDPLHIACEGQFLVVVAPEYAEIVLAALHSTPGGAQARVIGSLQSEHSRSVVARNAYGGSRFVDMLVGDPLPRIC